MEWLKFIKWIHYYTFEPINSPLKIWSDPIIVKSIYDSFQEDIFI